MTTWFISRHPGAEHWLKAKGIHFDRHLTHFSDEAIAAGDVVIGSLPVNLAAEICRRGASYFNLSLLVPESARGRELTQAELDSFQAKLEPFAIAPDTKAPELVRRTVEPKAAEPQAEAVPEPAPARQQARSVPLSKQQVFEWNNSIFKAIIYNQQDLSRGEQQAGQLLEQYSSLAGFDAAIVAELNRTLRQARRAHSLAMAFTKRARQGASQAELSDWVVKQSQDESPRVARSLRIQLKKHQAFKAQKAQTHQHDRNFAVSLPQVALVNGRHPQNLRFMAPAAAWDIYIDETGSQFGLEAEEAKETDTKLGRVVALALPQGHGLAPLEASHAIDLTLERIEQLLGSIIGSKAGVFGATTKADLLGYNWMNAIYQLARWTLLMLPMNEQPCRVRIHIENRAPFTNSQQLQALQDTLESELKTLQGERFAQLNLSLEIMDKNHAYNGYVDAIANCWGSQMADKRKLLARTAWRGQCLLQTTADRRIEDLYRDISNGDQVTPFQWFELCTAATDEPEHSLLHDMLEQLGQQVSVDPDAKLWQQYLTEVQERLQRKNFRQTGLTTALAWLERWQPDAEFNLPKHLQLELYSQQLAASNHGGATDLVLVGKLLKLISELTDELPREACNALLRIAVRSTHLFEFKGPLYEQLQLWLAKPIAVPGLLNHAKLHSTLGQLQAFAGEQEAARASFQQALAAFARLSDPQQRARERAQTELYLAVLEQDAQPAVGKQLTLELAQLAVTGSNTQFVQRMARSSDGPARFAHHALLRLLVSQPELTAELGLYLGQQAEWHSGEHHPWMLINAYRGWLLVRAGQQAEAQGYLQQAIDNCQAAGQPLLLWMAHSLAALAQSLGLQVTVPELAPAGHFPLTVLDSLRQASTDAARWAALAQCLPFNFR